MELNRRNTLIGLGAAAAAGGAVAGTGAFTSIEADRQVTVEVEGDADAYLALLPYDGPNGSKYATTNSAGALSVTLDKVNPNAVTTIDNVFQVLNQGSQPIAFYVEDSSDAVSFRSEGSSVEGEGSAVRLGVGETVTVGMEVDTTNGQAEGDTLLESVTIHAEAEEAPGAQAGDIIYVNDDGTGDYSSIQTAIDNANAGQTIQVAAGSYSGFSVGSSAPTGLTIAGAGGTSNTTAVDGKVTVNTNDTTISGLRISNNLSSEEPTPSAVVIQSGVSGAAITNNVIAGVSAPDSEQPKGIYVNDGVTGLRIVGNRIENVDAATTLNTDSALVNTAHGIQLNTGSSGSAISDVEVTNNVIDNVTSPRAAYGVQVQGDVSNITITSNEVSEVVGGEGAGSDGSADWAQGVALSSGSSSSGPSNVVISQNDLSVSSPTNDDPYGGSAVVIEGETDASTVSVNRNNLTSSVGLVIQGNQSSKLDATENWWDSSDGPEVVKDNSSGQVGQNTADNTYNAGSQGNVAALTRGTGGDIEYTPWLDAPFDEGGESFAPVEVNNPSSGVVSVPSFRAGVDALAADGTMRVNGGSGGEFDEGTDTFAIGVSGATIKSTAPGRPTLLNTDTSSGQDYAIRLQADGLRLEGIRVFTDDTADTPKEVRIRANNTTVTDCEVDRGHTAGSAPTEQSGIQVAPDGRTGIGIVGNRLNKAAIGMGGSNVTVKGNHVTKPAAEGIFSVVEGSEAYIIETNDVDDYDQGNFGLPALKLTDLPASVNGVSASTAEPYTDEILNANPEVPEVLVKNSGGSDSRKTQ